MKITFEGRANIGYLTASTISATIKEDIVTNSGVPEEEIEQLITVAFEMTRYNKESDVDAVIRIVGAFLNETEVQQLIDHLIKST